MGRWTATFGKDKCAMCGRGFVKRQHNAKYCSLSCQVKRNNLKESLPRKPHRPFCGICNEVIRVDYHVPDEVWELSLHRSHRNGYVCLDCFTRNADERGVEWSDNIKFYPISQLKDMTLKKGAEGG